MIASLSRNTPVIVQGITGRMGRTHAALMRAYGTNIVGGTSSRTDIQEAAGAVFANCRAAVLTTGAVVSVAMAPPMETLRAVEEALAAGIRLIVTVAEGIPLHDAMRIGRAVRRAGAIWIGRRLDWRSRARSSWVFCLTSAFALVRSASCRRVVHCSYECGYRLVQAGFGQSIWVGVGGDQVKGVRFADLLQLFFANSRTVRSFWWAKSAAMKRKNVPRCCSAFLGASRSMH